MVPQKSHKEWANVLRSRVGGSVAITKYSDDARARHVHIFSSESGGGIVAATIGLMEINQSRNSAVDVRTEVLLDSRANDPRVGNVLSTIAFYILKDGWRVTPGTVFENLVSMYFPDTSLPHIYFTTPFQWSDMGKVALSEQVIYPLLAIPVSEAEAELASVDSGRELENLWASRSVDVLNWERASVV